MIIEVTAHAHDNCRKKAVWNGRVLLIPIDDLTVDIVKIVFDDCFEVKSVALRVAEVEL